MSTTAGSRPKGLLEHTVTAVIRSTMPAGELTIQTPDGRELTMSGGLPGQAARIEIADTAVWRRLAMRGANGLADGYLAGEWDSPDLAAVLDWGAQNVIGTPNKIPQLTKPLSYALHTLRDNSVRGSKKNIEAHYDLGNDFYELWLDPSMTYSSALFNDCASPEEHLQPAQVAKWDRLLDVLQPSAKDHILEIGCGWGGFAVHAAKESGCKVTGVTLSNEQHDWATRLVEENDLGGKIEVRLQDYRHIPETFTAVASIEMFEAVGERWWPTFFGRVGELLGPGKRAALQTITLHDDLWESYRRSPDFTQEHIFPGGMLPTPSRFRAVAETQGLSVGEPHFFGESYARTLAEWRQNFEAVLPEVRELGFDERFIRMWRYYLVYCKACFNAGTANVMQVSLDT